MSESVRIHSLAGAVKSVEEVCRSRQDERIQAELSRVLKNVADSDGQLELAGRSLADLGENLGDFIDLSDEGSRTVIAFVRKLIDEARIPEEYTPSTRDAQLLVEFSRGCEYARVLNEDDEPPTWGILTSEASDEEVLSWLGELDRYVSSRNRLIAEYVDFIAAVFRSLQEKGTWDKRARLEYGERLLEIASTYETRRQALEERKRLERERLEREERKRIEAERRRREEAERRQREEEERIRREEERRIREAEEAERRAQEADEHVEEEEVSVEEREAVAQRKPTVAKRGKEVKERQNAGTSRTEGVRNGARRKADSTSRKPAASEQHRSADNHVAGRMSAAEHGVQGARTTSPRVGSAVTAASASSSARTETVKSVPQTESTSCGCGCSLIVVLAAIGLLIWFCHSFGWSIWSIASSVVAFAALILLMMYMWGTSGKKSEEGKGDEDDDVDEAEDEDD